MLPLGRQQPHESRVCLKIWEAGWRQLLAGAAQGSGKQPELYSYCPWAGLSQTTLGDWLRHIQSGEVPRDMIWSLVSCWRLQVWSYAPRTVCPHLNTVPNRRASVFLGALVPVPTVSAALAFGYGPSYNLLSCSTLLFPEIRGSLLCLRVPQRCSASRRYWLLHGGIIP